MFRTRTLKVFILFMCVTILPYTISAYEGDGVIEPGESETDELAKATQNPVADLISLPFQNNLNFDVGPLEKTQNVLNIQPVWPVQLSEDWNLITRTIAPVISQPAMAPGDDREFGLGDITFTAFLSPKKPGKWIWGVGPVVLLPTANDDALGSDKWGAGPSAVVLTVSGKWVVGSLFSNVWSTGGSGDQDINLFTWQYFVNYNMNNGWYLVSAPILTSNWEADSSDKWTVPFGGGIGKVFRIGKLPINVNAQAFYNAAKPDYGPDWSARLQVQLLFPK